MINSNGFQNFSYIVTALAACGAAFVAWLGLRAWQEQQRWIQGRGLAVSLLRAIHQVRRQARRTREDFVFFQDESQDAEQRGKKHEHLRNKAKEFLDEFREDLIAFESAAIEARLVFGIRLDSEVESLRDVERIIQSYLYSGLGRICPDGSQFQRDQSASLHQELSEDIYGRESVFLSVNKVVTSVEALVEAKFPR